MLCAAGATPERLEETIVQALERADPPVERRETDSPDLTPAMYRLLGRAEGLALARGREPTPDDLLAALVWEAGYGSSLLEGLGVERAALLMRLAEAGISVPPGEPEPFDRRPTKRVDVSYEHLMEIVDAMPSRLPEGTPFGFNLHHETRRAWIVVGEDVDAEPLIAAILEATQPE